MSARKRSRHLTRKPKPQPRSIEAPITPTPPPVVDGPISPPPPPAPTPTPLPIPSRAQELLVFIKDHWTMVAAAVVLGGIFLLLRVPQFKELFYGALRVPTIIIIVTTILYLWFKDTIRVYLVKGQFALEFHSDAPTTGAMCRMAITLIVLWMLISSATKCITSP